MRKCVVCGETKPLEDFGYHARCTDQRKPQCKSCIAEQSRKYRLENPLTVQNTRLYSKYKITLETYNKMLEEQGGVCAICGEVNPNGKALAVDHDHKCCPDKCKSCGECVRQLLCDRCNTLLGRVNDDVSLLNKAIEYLERMK